MYLLCTYGLDFYIPNYRLHWISDSTEKTKGFQGFEYFMLFTLSSYDNPTYLFWIKSHNAKWQKQLLFQYHNAKFQQ